MTPLAVPFSDQSTDARSAAVLGHELHLAGGGDVVGNIPQGLPGLRLPQISLEALLSATVVIALRCDDALYFANAAFFEEVVLEALSAKPEAKVLLIAGGGELELSEGTR